MNTNNGWKLVPERATKAMQDAWDTAPFSEDTDAEFHGAYAAMIAAAPASAQPERDWELTCEDCDGDGFLYVERRVGMCVTDVQTFKEDCECCEGRGFTIAFQDIPGIAEYVKSCRPASTVADEGVKDLTLAQKYEDACIAANANARDAERWRKAVSLWRITRVEVFDGVSLLNAKGISWDDLTRQVDAARAASQQGGE